VATRCEVQVAYAIGVARPMGVYVTTFGTGIVDDKVISEAVSEMFDFRPRALIETLDLLRPMYRPTAAYGHFGRTDKGSFTWERTDRAEELADRIRSRRTASKNGTNGHDKSDKKARKAARKATEAEA